MLRSNLRAGRVAPLYHGERLAETAMSRRTTSARSADADTFDLEADRRLRRRDRRSAPTPSSSSRARTCARRRSEARPGRRDRAGAAATAMARMARVSTAGWPRRRAVSSLSSPADRITDFDAGSKAFSRRPTSRVRRRRSAPARRPSPAACATVDGSLEARAGSRANWCCCNTSSRCGRSSPIEPARESSTAPRRASRRSDQRLSRSGRPHAA